MTAKKPKKIDRRVRRTRRQLKAALHDLIQQMSYDDITVADIVEEADISRATFYLHYDEKDDLLYASFASIVDDVEALLAESEDKTHFDVRAVALVIFKHSHEYRLIYKKLLKFDSFGTIMHLQISEMIGIMLKELQSTRSNDEKLPVPLDFYALQIIGIIYATLRWSLETNGTYTPEELTQMVADILSSGVPFISPS